MRRFTLFILLLFLFLNAISADGDRDKSKSFIQPEFLFGKTLPAHSNFPETLLLTNISLSLGKMSVNPDKDWSVYLNYPSTGISLSYSNYGSSIIGSSYTILPYLTLNTSKRHFNSFHIKVGLGMSYFTTYYNPVSNRRNLAIGSPFTWTFQTTVYYNLLIHKHIDLNFGLSYIHHSNGHTQLPNLGLNSFLVSLSSRIYLEPLDETYKKSYSKPILANTRQHFINARVGIGFHEFGGPESETGKVKRAVNVVSVSVGTIFKKVLRVHLGVAYRFYHQYYNYILDYEPEPYLEQPKLYASNIFVFAGGELLLGHVGIDGQLGLNLYKPFYAQHHELYEDDGEIVYWLKQMVTMRLGLKCYLQNNAKNPKYNVYLGAHINANFGQADFTEFSLGFVHRFKNKSQKVSGHIGY